MNTVIKVQNLSKKYTLGAVHTNLLSERLGNNLRSFYHRLLCRDNSRFTIHDSPYSDKDFWALRDVSFEVKQGEVVGIIGRNGAGKSTLLKVLSKITSPTAGRVEMVGRVASLLEVGTGFHPELTGRENIFLNGAILGMTKGEIRKKFDEIVAFAEVEKFIDTPVKRYSSGMYVRLAFAVAAHLEPEILIVDEVLAVGDTEFQKKCLGKMSDVSKEGRTVLFVSHNMQAVQALCSSAVLLKHGVIAADGKSVQIVSKYLSGLGNETGSCWSNNAGLGDATIRLVGLKVSSGESESLCGTLKSSEDVVISLNVQVAEVVRGLCIGFDLLGRDNVTLLRSYDTDIEPDQFRPIGLGLNCRSSVIPWGTLNAGRYSVAPRIGVHNQRWIVNCEPLVEFDIVLDHGKSSYWNVLDAGNRPGLIAPILKWIF